MGTEEICIKKIESGIRAISTGTKTPADSKCGFFLNQLKTLNLPMYEDLLKKYKEVLIIYNNQK